MFLIFKYTLIFYFFLILNLILERINAIENTDSLTGFFIWISTAIVMATISTSVCHVFGQEAQGAGVAEIKCILTGSRLYEYLNFRILAAKFISLITAIGGGTNKKFKKVKFNIKHYYFSFFFSSEKHNKK